MSNDERPEILSVLAMLTECSKLLTSLNDDSKPVRDLKDTVHRARSQADDLFNGVPEISAYDADIASLGLED